MAEVRPDPRPSRRYVASGDEWAQLWAEKIGPCRGCGSPPFLCTMHHVVARSLGGDDVAANLIPLCGSGTTGCHGAIENHTPGWEAIASAVRESLSSVEIHYAIAKKGKDWLQRYYPHDELLCARCRKAIRTPKPESMQDAPRLPARKGKLVSFVVPDDAENGAEVIDTLVDSLAEELGFDDESSRLRRYHAMAIALAFALVNINQLKEERSGGDG